MKKLVKWGMAWIMAGALLLAVPGCSGLFKWSSQAESDFQKWAADCAPLIAMAEKLVGGINANYNFIAILAQGTAEIAGLKIPQDIITSAGKVVKLFDDGLKTASPIVNAVANKQAIQLDPAQVAQDLADASAAYPQAVAQFMQNPAVAELYQAYLALQTKGQAPVPVQVAPTAVPTASSSTS